MPPAQDRNRNFVGLLFVCFFRRFNSGKTSPQSKRCSNPCVERTTCRKALEANPVFFFRGGGNIRSGGPIAALTKRMKDERWELDLESAGEQRRRGGGGEGEVDRLRGCVRRVHRKHLLHGSESGTRAAASQRREPGDGKVSAALMGISQLSCAARGGVGPLSAAHLSAL